MKRIILAGGSGSRLGRTPYAAYLKRLVGEPASVAGQIEPGDRIAAHAERLVV